MLHAGAASVATKADGRPLTLTADRASDAALLLEASTVVPVHCDGWSHYTESGADVERSFRDAGIADRLCHVVMGRWVLRHR